MDTSVDTIHLSSTPEHIRQYVEKCQLDDGGFFFARIPPSSLMDTYYAVKILSALELEPSRPDKIKDYVLNTVKKFSYIGINGLFAAAEVLHELKGNLNALSGFLLRLNALKNSMGGFGAVKNLDLEIVSELETTYRVLVILDRLDIEYDHSQILGFALKFKNDDGGFGHSRISTLASTFYATEILNMTGYDKSELKLTPQFLRGKENVWKLNYIEDIYWLIFSSLNMHEKVHMAEWMVSFVKGCQRASGGFARKDVMGIATLQDTWYAVSILKALNHW